MLSLVTIQTEDSFARSTAARTRRSRVFFERLARLRPLASPVYLGASHGVFGFLPLAGRSLDHPREVSERSVKWSPTLDLPQLGATGVDEKHLFIAW